MAAIVKANASLTAGGLAVLKRNFTASDTGQMIYSVDYCCLSQFASRWTPAFRTGAQPPTPLPSSLLQLSLTKTPTLVDLSTEVSNGLAYFRATYSAGVETDVTITEESNIRNFSWTVTYPENYCYRTNTFGPFNDARTVCVETGLQTVTYNFDYVSYTQTATSKNTRLPAVSGRVSDPINSNFFLRHPGVRSTISQTSTTKNARGEYTYSVSSTGIYK